MISDDEKPFLPNVSCITWYFNDSWSEASSSTDLAAAAASISPSDASRFSLIGLEDAGVRDMSHASVRREPRTMPVRTTVELEGQIEVLMLLLLILVINTIYLQNLEVTSRAPNLSVPNQMPIN